MKTFLRIFLILLLLAMTLYFNLGLIDIRMGEMNYLIGKVAAQQDVPMSLGIVAKYELIKNRMLYGEQNPESYALEAKIQALTSGDQYNKQESGWKMRIYKMPIRFVVNAIRLSIGKPVISLKEDDKIFNVLEIGYFWERNRKYQDAINVYNQILDKQSVAPDIQSAVMIHKAFCHSMLSEYDVSKHIFERVISMFPNTEAGILSWKLLDFIVSMEKQRSLLEKKSMTYFEKAKQFYMVMDYRNSVKYFSMFLQENTNSPLKQEALFYKGRSHEELGEGEEAIMTYQHIIRDDTTRQWAKQANRLMLMIGEFYDQKKQISDEAKKQLAAYKDQNFINDIQQYADMVSESSLRKELMKDSDLKEAKVKQSNDSLLNIINMIGSLDLTGEKEAKKREEVEKIRSELISQGKLSDAEIREIERRKSLEDNPFRRPGAIKSIIDDNSSQLKYLYNRRLREGVKLSGKMVIEISIKPTGAVGNARIVRSDMGDKTFEDAIVNKISTWKFKSVSDSLGDMVVNYPIEFSEED